MRPPIHRPYLLTHSGNFHTDDVFCGAVLSILYPHMPIIRSRDPSYMDDAFLTYDVGHVYDPINRQYDHHMPNPPLRGPDAPYSSAGMIWRDFGHDFIRHILRDTEHRMHHTVSIDAVWALIDTTWVTSIDAEDNGYAAPHHSPINSLVQYLRPTRYGMNPTDTTYMDAYMQAMTITRTMLAHACEHTAIRLENEAYIQHLMDTQAHNIEATSTLYSERPIDDLSSLSDGPVAFIVAPRITQGQTEWTVQCVPPPGSLYDQKIPLPAHLAGLSGNALEAASHIPGLVFVHHRQFLAVGTTQESIVHLIQSSIRDH